MNARRIVVAVSVATLLAGLTACGAPTGSDSPTSEPIGDPTPVATDETGIAAASGERPDAAIDADCTDLTNPAQLDPIFAVAVDLAPPTRTAEYIGARIADEWVVRQAGGIACQWSDPDGITTSEGRYLSGLDLRLLPASGPQWQQFSDAEGDGSDRRFVCEDWGQCDYDRFFGGAGGSTGWWLSLSAFNIDALASPTAASLQTLTAPVFSAVAATVEALPAPDPAWSA
ncbi:MAG: hypothetical protein ABI566_06470, partial [Pseudolysinimonas sp.]